MKWDDEYEFLRKFFEVLRDDETGIFNYTGMAETLGTNRHVIAGAVTTLVALGALSFIQKSTKNKFFQISRQFSVRVVNNRLQDLLGLREEAELSKAEWERYMRWLIPLVLIPDQARQYHQWLKDGGTPQFAQAFDREYYEGRLGESLPTVVREPLSDLFRRVVLNGLSYLSAEAWQGLIEK